MLGQSASSKLNWSSYIAFVAKTASNNIETLIRSIRFFVLILLFISLNLPYGLAWNTGAMLLPPTWIC